MPRPSRPWFRFYVEALNDWKLRRLTPTERWLWVAILAFARGSCVSGYLMVSERHALSDAELATYADVPLKVVRVALPRMVEFGMIERDEELDAWHVAHWNERQFESDNTTERTAKHRSKERDRNVPTSLPGTGLSVTETETDTEEESSSPVETRESAPTPGENDDDDRSRVVLEALTILAKREFDRQQELGKTVSNKPGWLRAVIAERCETHAETLALNCWPDGETAAQLADRLEPPVAAKLQVVQGARIPAPPSNPCVTCKGSALMELEDEMYPCPDCSRSGRASPLHLVNDSNPGTIS